MVWHTPATARPHPLARCARSSIGITVEALCAGVVGLRAPVTWARAAAAAFSLADSVVAVASPTCGGLLLGGERLQLLVLAARVAAATASLSPRRAPSRPGGAMGTGGGREGCGASGGVGDGLMAPTARHGRTDRGPVEPHGAAAAAQDAASRLPLGPQAGHGHEPAPRVRREVEFLCSNTPSPPRQAQVPPQC
ncbi:hypothetical protein U9M48_020348 [Paspalum notatum var. saurae]|uniref:Uncharacterized protein n=1 Tax=Paspalum notatum var. saurae TaxID=547442 RepID=A0AAQ3TGQ5_PASNO